MNGTTRGTSLKRTLHGQDSVLRLLEDSKGPLLITKKLVCERLHDKVERTVDEAYMTDQQASSSARVSLW